MKITEMVLIYVLIYSELLKGVLIREWVTLMAHHLAKS